MRLLLCAMLVFALSACSSSSRPNLAPDQAALASPPDFWMTVTVVGPAREATAEPLPRDMRPGRYVVEPDRQLRVSMGRGADEKSFPPALRRLSAEQSAELWHLVNAGGLMKADHPAGLKRLDLVDRTPATTTNYVLVAHANGKRRVLQVNAEDANAAGRAEIRTIVDTLAGWAWVE